MNTEERAKQYADSLVKARGHLYENYGLTRQYDNVTFDGYDLREAFEEGAKWQANSELREPPFAHPIGTKVWWVGYELSKEPDGGFDWIIKEMEVSLNRTTYCENKIYKQIFLSGLSSYEGENWFDDAFSPHPNMPEVMCSGQGLDYVFDTEEDARKYLDLANNDYMRLS